MCGIAGIIGPVQPASDRIERALALMDNRGPDARGTYFGTLREHQIGLLHTRLSIIDLDERANQPFVHDDCVLIFNGEIYNYVELRDELKALGYGFRTTSDTEVIVQAYRRWGKACVDHFEGMWAFALLDRRAGSVMLSRDPFAEKPLYIMPYNGALYFGSEVKFLAALSGHKPAINIEHVCRYLVNGYKALYKPRTTFFHGVHELPAANSMILTGPTPVEPERYWSLDYEPEAMDGREAVERVRESLFEAVRIRLRADVPIAFCLSGGVDSTSLACIAAKHFGQRIHTFSIIDSDERYDEGDNIQAVVDALGCDHHVIRTTTEGFFPSLRELVAYHDAPVATITYYLHSFLSRSISEGGYKVAISGSGADELFTGYYDHYSFWLAEMRDRPDFECLLEDWRQSYGGFVRNPVLQDPLVFARNPSERGHIFLDQEIFEGFLARPFHEAFAEEHLCGNPLRNRMLNEAFHETVPVALHEDDRNSMFYSVENRSPYLDRKLADCLYSVPVEHLIRDGYAKWLLRASADGYVPDSVRLDKQKRGFNASIDSLIDRSDPDTIDQLLGPSPIYDVVRRETVEDFLRQDLTDNSFSKFLFSFVSAKTFLEHHQDWQP